MSVEAGDGVRGTNDLGDVEGVEVALPAVVPTSVDDEASVPLVVSHVGVLTRRRDVAEDIGVGGELVPLHGADIQVTRGVAAVVWVISPRLGIDRPRTQKTDPQW